jgi:hypothetical protein
MIKLNNENMETVFAKIRSDFEKRGNEQGLEILDSCEEQWNATHSLTDRQVAWLEKQFNGSWRPSGRSAIKDYEECREISPEKRGLIPISSTSQGTEQLLDAMIHERLMEQGKAIVDAKLLTELEELISEIKQAPNR